MWTMFQFFVMLGVFVMAGGVDHTRNGVETTTLRESVKVDEQHTKVYNANESKHKQVVRITNGSSSCSSTLVSGNVLVTAAHCVSGKSSDMVGHLIDGSRVRIRCTKSEGAIQNPPSGEGMYDAAIQNDVAACVIRDPVPSMVPACIGKPLDIGEKALYVGFGQSNTGSTPFFDGKQRSREVPIVSRSGGILITYSRRLRENGDAALGGGDSGGFTGRKDAGGQLWISGVNSASSSEKRRPGLSPILNQDAYNSSTDLSSSKSQKFLKSWASDNGVKICGVNAALSDFGGSGESPSPVPPTPPDDSRSRFQLGLGLETQPPSVLVDSLLPGSVAEKELKLRPGDRILGINGKQISGAQQLREEAKKILAGSGSAANFKIQRSDGTIESVRATLPSDPSSRSRFTFGLYPKDALAGAKIGTVSSGGVGDRFGLKAGEVITAVNSVSVSTAAEAAQAIRRVLADSSIRTLTLSVQTAKGGMRQLSISLPR